MWSASPCSHHHICQCKLYLVEVDANEPSLSCFGQVFNHSKETSNWYSRCPTGSRPTTPVLAHLIHSIALISTHNEQSCYLPTHFIFLSKESPILTPNSISKVALNSAISYSSKLHWPIQRHWPSPGPLVGPLLSLITFSLPRYKYKQEWV